MTDAIVIAHRGASGYLPEHTLAAKALAYGLGADFLEQDVLASRDAELVVLHDLHLDDVTDVAQRFPGRHRDDGRHYVIDFDLAELQTLTVFERRRPGSDEARFPQRFPVATGIGHVVTLDQELQFVQGLNKSTGRRVGIYPEIKHPRWHFEHGIDLAQLLLTKLETFGYTEFDDAVYLQCFDADELRRVRNDLRCKLKLIQLVGTEPADADVLTPERLRVIAAYANGLGPNHSQLLQGQGGRPRVTSVARWASDAGLQVHPYTFRADELPPYVSSLEHLLEIFLVDIGVQGVFCDHPDVAVRVRDTVAHRTTRP
jgi:glycerophosphoryl diester phosphodiesterase